jgi:hypothetical protein
MSETHYKTAACVKDLIDNASMHLSALYPTSAPYTAACLQHLQHLVHQFAAAFAAAACMRPQLDAAVAARSENTMHHRVDDNEPVSQQQALSSDRGVKLRETARNGVVLQRVHGNMV